MQCYDNATLLILSCCSSGKSLLLPEVLVQYHRLDIPASWCCSHKQKLWNASMMTQKLWPRA